MDVTESERCHVIVLSRVSHWQGLLTESSLFRLKDLVFKSIYCSIYLTRSRVDAINSVCFICSKFVQIQFNFISTENNFDFIYVYDGKDTFGDWLLDKFGGRISDQPLPRFTSTQPNMLIRFTSDYSITYKGFNATYSSTTTGKAYSQRFSYRNMPVCDWLPTKSHWNNQLETCLWISLHLIGCTSVTDLVGNHSETNS